MRSAAKFDPLLTLRQALGEQEACKSHPAIRRCLSRADAKDWWDVIQHCPPAKRLEHLRWFGQNDLYFLLRYMLQLNGYEQPVAWVEKVEHDFVFARAAEVQDAPYNHLDIHARGHFKSLVQSYGRNIQEILIDPEVTIGIFSHSRPMAKGFLLPIKLEFERNQLLKDVYPDILWQEPEKQAPKWSEDQGIIVKRRGNRNTATVEAWGLVDGQPTSKRFDVLHYDDVISRKEVSSDMIDKATREFENSLALTASDPIKYRYLATIQEVGDTTMQLMQKNFGPIRKHAAIDEEGNPVYFSEEKLSQLRQMMSPRVFALQYLLDPARATADTQIGFDATWICTSARTPERPTMRVYIVVDPAGKGPHANSRFAAWVMGIDAFKTWHVLDIVLDTLDLVERGDTVLRLWEKWKPDRVGYESYGMQGDVEYIKDRAKREKIDLDMRALGGQWGKSKDTRIEMLMPLFRGGKIIFPSAGITYTTKAGEQMELCSYFKQHEYEVWPFSKRKDMFDALARICDPALGVVPPRMYQDTSTQVRRLFGSSDESTGSGSWMAE